jgi:hypothetical protein
MVFYGRSDAAAAQHFVAPAVSGFFRSIELGQASPVEPGIPTRPASANLQDILRLLTLWFSHGASPDVEAALQEGFGHVSIDTWLVVIPQVRTLCLPLPRALLRHALPACALCLASPRRQQPRAAALESPRAPAS